MARGINSESRRVPPAERAKVNHATRLGPKKCPRTEVAVGPPDDLAQVIHRKGLGIAPAAEHAQIDHPACLRPRECMGGVVYVRGNVAPPDDLARVAYSISHGVGAAKRAQIDHAARWRPKKRMHVAVWEASHAGHLARGVHSSRRRPTASETEVRYGIVLA